MIRARIIWWRFLEEAIEDFGSFKDLIEWIGKQDAEFVILPPYGEDFSRGVDVVLLEGVSLPVLEAEGELSEE